MAADLNLIALEKLGTMDVADLLLASHLYLNKTPRELGVLLNIDPSSVRWRVTKLSRLLSEVLNTEVTVAEQRRSGQPYELTVVGEHFARWAAEHLRLFQKQIEEQSSKVKPRVEIGSVHMMLRLAADLRYHLTRLNPELEVRITPVHSRHVFGAVKAEFSTCDCFLSPFVETNGELVGIPEGFHFEKIGEEQMAVLLNAALVSKIGLTVGPVEIEQWLAYMPLPGVTRSWLVESLGSDRCERLTLRRPKIHDSMNQVQVLRFQPDPALMLATKSFVDWAHAARPPSYDPPLKTEGKLSKGLLTKELQKIRIPMGMLYRAHEFERSPALTALLHLFRRIQQKALPAQPSS